MALLLRRPAQGRLHPRLDGVVEGAAIGHLRRSPTSRSWRRSTSSIRARIRCSNCFFTVDSMRISSRSAGSTMTVRSLDCIVPALAFLRISMRDAPVRGRRRAGSVPPDRNRRPGRAHADRFLVLRTGGTTARVGLFDPPSSTTTSERTLRRGEGKTSRPRPNRSPASTVAAGVSRATRSRRLLNSFA